MLLLCFMFKLGKMRLTIPCRSMTCSHLQCFDATLYIQMNEKKPTWVCPVCDKKAPYEHLIIDGWAQHGCTPVNHNIVATCIIFLAPSHDSKRALSSQSMAKDHLRVECLVLGCLGPASCEVGSLCVRLASYRCHQIGRLGSWREGEHFRLYCVLLTLKQFFSGPTVVQVSYAKVMFM